MDSDPAQADGAANGTDQLVDYYDQLADRYDADRFGNSYGRYVDAQERRLLRRWLAPYQRGEILDLACGTGRLLGFASHGLDASAAMVRIAQEKHPGKQIRCAPASEMGEFRVRFDAIFCLHLFMHLTPAEIAALLQASYDQLGPAGTLIFDVPSALRRRLTGFRAAGWHAATALAPHEVAVLAGHRWRIKATRGILSFPIHRLPGRIRPFVRPLDDLVGATPLKPLCSYVFYCLEHKR